MDLELRFYFVYIIHTQYYNAKVNESVCLLR